MREGAEGRWLSPQNAGPSSPDCLSEGECPKPKARSIVGVRVAYHGRQRQRLHPPRSRAGDDPGSRTRAGAPVHPASTSRPDLPPAQRRRTPLQSTRATARPSKTISNESVHGWCGEASKGAGRPDGHRPWRVPGEAVCWCGSRPATAWTVSLRSLTAFCLFSPGTNLSRTLWPTAGLRTRISVPSMIPVCPRVSGCACHPDRQNQPAAARSQPGLAERPVGNPSSTQRDSTSAPPAPSPHKASTTDSSRSGQAQPPSRRPSPRTADRRRHRRAAPPPRPGRRL
ncbi:hypothetical protein SAMN05216371_7513 [Streptomyces sp. TLI_053]|nr:hypothetical protein SAMN05216371_7513 [Streptomyces sp. TLI_053]